MRNAQPSVCCPSLAAASFQRAMKVLKASGKTTGNSMVKATATVTGIAADFSLLPAPWRKGVARNPARITRQE